MYFRAFFLLFSLFIFSSSLAANDAFIIRTKKTIPVYIENPQAEDLTNASKLLKDYVFQIVQSRLEITNNNPKKAIIQLKQNPQLHPDGFVISIQKNRLTIEGGTRKGTTYAVIHLLESLGCRFLSPDFKIVPKQNQITFPCQTIEDKPVNDVRIINLYFGENPEYRDWLRLNTIEEVYPEGYFVHTFHRLVPWEAYFTAYPEYFALVNGKRSIDQICPSNPELRNIIAQNLEKEMKLQPGKQKWSVSQNDNFSYCQCDQCKHIIAEEGSPAGPVIHLVNDMAARFPDKIISTLAYQYSRKAPFKVKPLKNVEVMLCTIELHRHESIETNPECADFKKDMEDWGKISSNIFLWDYTINFNHSISPFPNLHILQPNIRFFTKNHVNALFEQSNSTTGYEFSELKAYLLSKLMWNPELDLEQEKQQFLQNYYGSASQHVADYIHALETALKETKSKLWIYEHPVVHQNGLFSENRVKNYKAIFDRAEEAVKDNPVFLNHVQLARLPIQYAEMEIAANNMFSKRGWYEITNGKAIPNEELKRTLDAFEKTCIRNKVPTVNEAELSPENYIRSLRRMIDVNMEGNEAFGKKVSASVLPDKKYQEGDLAYLTNGVNGASDYNIHWLGWFGTDTELILDLESLTSAKNISINSLWNGKSWILHPAEVACSVSSDGKNYFPVGKIQVAGEQQKEDPIRNYLFQVENKSYRYVKIAVKGTKKLFNWHPSAGEPSWFFLDEISVH
ncbi:hypothetical protein D3C87_199780 [compost metagenome]